MMLRNSAPPGWEGDAARLANHVMTRTAKKLDADTAALEVGLAAMDVYCKQVHDLARSHTRLVGERDALAQRVAQLRDRLASEAPTAGLASDVEHVNAQVGAWNESATRWGDSLTQAQQRLVGALKSADTKAEAMKLRQGEAVVTSLEAYAKKIAKDPDAVRRWWTGLNAEQRLLLKVQFPRFIGSLDGVPIADRDDVNRAELTALHQQLTGIPAAMRTEAQERTLKRIKKLRDALDTTDLGRDVKSFLLLFNTSAAGGDGYAALSYGNPETADHVSVNVPGFSSTLDDFNGVAGDAANVYRAANQQQHGSVASIAWLGYNAPDVDFTEHGPTALVGDPVAVTNEARAVAGARRLSRFVAGLRATDEGTRTHLTLIGHSYGSVVVAKASPSAGEDDVVLVGSPGAGSGNTSAKDLKPGHVYVGAAKNDPISHLGVSSHPGLGSDPASKKFDANRFKVADGTPSDLLTRSGIETALHNHSAYFTMHQSDGHPVPSESLRNIADVVTGRGADIDAVGGRTTGSDSTWLTGKAVGGLAGYALTDGPSLVRKSINHVPGLP